MTGFDIAVLLLIGLGAVTGFLRGFVQEIMALAAWFLALFAIKFLHTPLSQFLEPHVGTSSGAYVLGFAILLLVPYAAVKAMARSLGTVSRNSVLGPADRALGFGFGAIKGFIITVLGFSVMMLGFDIVWTRSGRPQWITHARTYPFIDSTSEQLVQALAERRKAADEASKIPGKPTGKTHGRKK